MNFFMKINLGNIIMKKVIAGEWHRACNIALVTFNSSVHINDEVKRIHKQKLPDPSVSNKLNASRISSISSSLRPGRSYDLAGFLLAALARDAYIRKIRGEAERILNKRVEEITTKKRNSIILVMI
jgi:hypothetical protein